MAKDNAVDAIVKTVVDYLRSQGRLSLLESVVQELSREAERYHKKHTAIITSAHPLPAEKIDAIKNYVEDNYGKVENVESSIDPSLIAGFTVRIGDNIIDHSLLGKLDSVKQSLIFGT